MGYAGDRVRVVLNRADASVGVTVEDVVGVIGRRPDIMVPSHRDVVRSVNEGAPIVASRPRSDAARAFTTLAAAYAPQERERTSRRLLRRRKG
jgi:MinD-like ATPase involved in chromosome partitioning or flagellar assembly